MATKTDKKQPKWVVIRATMKGLISSPLLVNNPDSRDNMKRMDSAEDAAKTRLYAENGVIGLPTRQLRAALVNAGSMNSITMGGRAKKITTGTQSKTSKRTTLLDGLLRIREQFLPLTPDKWVVDTRQTRNPQTGGMNPTSRPRFDEWGLSATIEIDESMLSSDLARQLFDDAGRWYGLGDFRNGPYGKFEVVGWEKVEE